MAPAESRTPQPWVVPLLLALLGAGALWLGRSTECLSLDGAATPGGPSEVCSTLVQPGAVVFAVICWATALFVWQVQRPPRRRGRRR